MAPPPVRHALFLSFQVSLPGSPGAGIVYVRHSSFPVGASSPAIQSRTPPSPPAAPTMILSPIGSGADVMWTSGVSGNVVSHATFPVSLLVATMRGGQLAAVMTR